MCVTPGQTAVQISIGSCLVVAHIRNGHEALRFPTRSSVHAIAHIALFLSFPASLWLDNEKRERNVVSKDSWFRYAIEDCLRVLRIEVAGRKIFGGSACSGTEFESGSPAYRVGVLPIKLPRSSADNSSQTLSSIIKRPPTKYHWGMRSRPCYAACTLEFASDSWTHRKSFFDKNRFNVDTFASNEQRIRQRTL